MRYKREMRCFDSTFEATSKISTNFEMKFENKSNFEMKFENKYFVVIFNLRNEFRR